MRVVLLKENLMIGGTERSTANISKIISTHCDTRVLLFDASLVEYQYGGKLVDMGIPAANSNVKRVIRTIKRAIWYAHYLKNNKINITYQLISIRNPINLLRFRNTAKIISARDFAALKAKIKRYKKCLNNSDALICNSKYIRDYYLSYYPEDKGKVFCIYNIINVEHIIEEGKRNTNEEYLEFLSKHKHNAVSVGRFCREKGFEYLIKAVALVNNSEDLGLILVGDGELKHEYEKIIYSLGLEEKVFLTGFQDNPYKYMSKCNFYILSSISEGFPNVIGEAMALSLPIIATNCFSGPAEILKTDQSYSTINDHFIECEFGILTPPFEEHSDNEAQISILGDAIKHLMHNEYLMEKYRCASYERSLVFSEDNAYKQFAYIFNELAKKRGWRDVND